MSIKESDSFCIIPWLQMVTGETGEFHVCTHSRMETILDQNAVPYQIEKAGDLEAARNSNYLKKLRQDMLSGKRPEMCSPCFELEDVGLDSYRQRMNRKFEDRIPDLIEETSVEGEVPVQFQYLHVRLGNFCNLKCRMCDPISSRALMNELEHVYSQINTVQPRIQSLKNPDWFKKEVAWQEIYKYLPSIDQIYIVGGEPFLIKEAFEFLRVLIGTGYSSKITLHYNTNLTYLPKDLFQLWPQFKSVHLHVSIDAFDRLNHYIRYPTKWGVLDKNLRILDEKMEVLNCKEIGINATLQVYNVFGITDLFWYLKENFKNLSPYPNLEPVMFRPQLSIQILPPELKKLAENRMKEFIILYFKKYGSMPPRQFLNRIKQMIRYMNAKDTSSLIPEFKKFTQYMDLKRNQSVLEFVPEIEKLMR